MNIKNHEKPRLKRRKFGAKVSYIYTCMCAGFWILEGEYEWACSRIWNDLFELEYMGLHDDHLDLVWLSYDWESGIKSAELIWW